MTEKLSAFTASTPSSSDYLAGATLGSPNKKFLVTDVINVGITINTTGIIGGTSGRVLYDNAGTVGEAANFNIVSGQPNVPFGSAYFYGGSSFSAVDSLLNVTLGTLAGNFGNVTGFANVSLGNQAGQSLTSGIGNMNIGQQSGQSITSGHANMNIGQAAGTALTSGSENVALGHAALHAETTGSENIAIGELALSTQNGNNGNTAIGWHALLNAAGAGSVAIGTQAMINATTGAFNVAIGGSSPLGSLTTHQQCVAIGEQALGNVDASSNTGIGYHVGLDLTTGDSNTFYGQSAGRGITTGRANTWIGTYQSLVNSASNTIALSDGDANLRLDYGITNAGAWTFNQPPVVPGYTVAGLPITITGAIARVTDGTAGLVNGNTVTGGHSTPYLVWFNGTNWTVVGE